MIHNEDSRVKIPAVLHLIRLGYQYISKKGNEWDKSNNIFKDIFISSLIKINKNIDKKKAEAVYDEVSLMLTNNDLGKIFFERIISKSGIKLIDFENIDNNNFNVVTELPYKNDDEEFRPDITLLINGMPLAFIEVKKPNNQAGILAEHKRIEKRFQNLKFKNFVNLTQIILFSNNMEYNDQSHLPIEGAFYSTTSYNKIKFNYFREENGNNELSISEVDNKIEDFVLLDNNLPGIKNSPEFITNKNPNSPTNRACTSIFRKERLLFFLEYGIVYVKKAKEYQKHIMRYPQLFGVKSIKKYLDKGNKKGVIWHTQGSGKTALAFYSIKYLKEYFKKKKIIPKFYFIVDRIDLLEQAQDEFQARDIEVHTIQSREDFAKEIKSNIAIHNTSGKEEISVVNIQKFENDDNIIKNNDYSLKIQKIYFLDEVHRSYKPTGKFLVNLHQSDKEAIKIGLTGTPLLGSKYNTRSLFGNYIHRYFYNSSIRDGYTLRLIREEIETKYKFSLEKTLKEIKLLKGDLDRKQLYSHYKFVQPLLNYITDDLEASRISLNDHKIGGMVICDSHQQAEKMYEIFLSNNNNKTEKIIVKEDYILKEKEKNKIKKAGLILYDAGTKDDRKKIIKQFKQGDIDILFVYNMLLTGFDSPRLKKLYIGRKIESHNLLQALTRVNRSYKDTRYGYIVDFADIEKEFDKTNKAYLEELQLELGDEIANYENMFKTDEEINKEISEIKNFLFKYDSENLEIFSQQINQINDKKKVQEIVKVLKNARELHNILKLKGNVEIFKNLNIENIFKMFSEANNRLNLINTKEKIESSVDTTSLLNIAMEEVMFAFTKINQEELILADELKNFLRKTRESLLNNFDPKDPEFVALKEELERLFQKKNLNEVDKIEMKNNIKKLENIYSASSELSRKNELLKAKYSNDEKYARLHKRLMEKDPLTDNELKLFNALIDLKKTMDSQILENSNVLNNESYVKRMASKVVIEKFNNIHNFSIDLEKINKINNMLVKEYINEYNGVI